MADKICGFQWALEDPNDEDRALGIQHRCYFPPEHEGDRHRCGCGEYEPLPLTVDGTRHSG